MVALFNTDIEEYKKTKKDLDPQLFGVIAIIIAVICLCCPYRTVINKLANKDSVLDDFT